MYEQNDNRRCKDKLGEPMVHCIISDNDIIFHSYTICGGYIYIKDKMYEY